MQADERGKRPFDPQPLDHDRDRGHAAPRVAVVITGFVWLPFAQPDSPFRSVWDAICSSAGLVRNRPATAVVEHPGYKTSAVVVSADMLPTPTAVSIGRGGTLALQCTMCHGDRGLSNANTPNLAGQYAPAIYKQLQDYKSGARTNAIMSPRVANLTDQDMRDLAAYYCLPAALTALSSGRRRPCAANRRARGAAA